MNNGRDLNRLSNMAQVRSWGFSYEKIGLLYSLSRQRIHQLIGGTYKRRRNVREV